MLSPQRLPFSSKPKAEGPSDEELHDEYGKATGRIQDCEEKVEKLISRAQFTVKNIVSLFKVAALPQASSDLNFPTFEPKLLQELKVGGAPEVRQPSLNPSYDSDLCPCCSPWTDVATPRNFLRAPTFAKKRNEIGSERNSPRKLTTM